MWNKWSEFLRCAAQTSVSNNDCMIVCSPVSGLERLKTRKMPWDFTPCRSPINETENLPRATSPSGTAGAYWPCWRLPAALRSSPVWLSGNRFVNADMQTGCCVCWDVLWLRCLTRPSHGVSDFRQSDLVRPKLYSHRGWLSALMLLRPHCCDSEDCRCSEQVLALTHKYTSK